MMGFSLFPKNWNSFITKIQKNREEFYADQTSDKYDAWVSAIKDARNYMERKITTKPLNDDDKERMFKRMKFLEIKAEECAKSEPSLIADFLSIVK